MVDYDKHAEYLVAPNTIAAVHYIDSDGLYLETEFLRRNSIGRILLDRVGVTVRLPEFDPFTHQARYRRDSEVLGWVIEPKGIPVQPVPSTLDGAKEQKIAQLATFRFQVETGGITLFGSSIRTDRESQAQLTGAYISLKFGLADTVDWKGPNGWTVLKLAQIEPIAQAVSRHVQSCFSMEKVHSDAINKLTTIEEVMSYDITVGF